jgi:sialate O-acetylesterase
MAVSSDLGDSLDIHPRYKRPVGERLARQALHHDYGMTDVTPCGPVLKEAMWKGEKIVLTFDYADGLKTSDGQALRCFEVAGYDEAFVTVEAVIEDGKVVLSVPMQSPMYVRYTWQPFTRANLVNGEGLPCSTFQATISR